METIEYRTIDKADWLRGPWDDEPDKRQWQDAETGLPCLIVRGPSGALCGYVGVAPGHPAHGLPYDAGGYYSGQGEPPTLSQATAGAAINGIEVHGGLTFAHGCSGGAEDHGICHKPAEGEPDHVWWFGFDCAHSGDISPAYDGKYGPSWHEDRYRDVAYVAEQVARLAKQLHAIRA